MRVTLEDRTYVVVQKDIYHLRGICHHQSIYQAAHVSCLLEPLCAGNIAHRSRNKWDMRDDDTGVVLPIVSRSARNQLRCASPTSPIQIREWIPIESCQPLWSNE
jgi:hypothetical protein